MVTCHFGEGYAATILHTASALCHIRPDANLCVKHRAMGNVSALHETPDLISKSLLLTELQELNNQQSQDTTELTTTEPVYTTLRQSETQAVSIHSRALATPAMSITVDKSFASRRDMCPETDILHYKNELTGPDSRIYTFLEGSRCGL